jgi:prephenate dehydrogenase
MLKLRNLEGYVMKVGIIGLGLMGGSLGLALKNVSFVDEILGFDLSDSHQKEALELELVDKIVDFNGIQNVDIILLTIPVEGIISSLQNFDNISDSCTIIDLGSTKAKIVSKVPKTIRKNFVAAHPMTGTEKFGPSAAFASLYTNKVVVLCDIEDSGEEQVSVAYKLFEEINMRIVTMNSVEHDKHVAYISHLPHAISFALANTVLTHEDTKSILNLAAGGFKDMSRLAKSSPNMWEDVFRQNSDNVIETIEIFEKELSKLKKQIKDESWSDLHKKMVDANHLHEIL